MTQSNEALTMELLTLECGNEVVRLGFSAYGSVLNYWA